MTYRVYYNVEKVKIVVVAASRLHRVKKKDRKKREKIENRAWVAKR